MAKYKAYPEYKSVNSSWLNRIPNGWLLLPLKYRSASPVKDGPHETPQFLDEGIPFLSVDGIQDNKLTFAGCRFISSSAHFKFSQKCKPLKGDILLGKAASVGKVALVDTTREFNVWSPLAVITPIHESLSKFIYYSLQSTILQDQCDVFANSNTQKNLGMNTIDNLEFTFPSNKEALAISSFLDYEIAKIDNLIEKQQQLIELLKEKRQAVISHAVTKGLNPDVPMKDSGVVWLGKIPKNWGMVPLKYLCEFNGGGTPNKDNLSYWKNGTIPWISPKDMKNFLINEAQDYVTERAVSESSTKIIRPNSLLIVVRSGILQRTIPVAINLRQVTLNQDMKALYFTEKMRTQFIAYFIMGHVNALLTKWTKEGATVESIEHEYLANSLIPVPPRQEQQAIINYVEKQIQIFQDLEKSASLGIQLLKERRTALISAAVTGKIDVRNWVAPAAEAETLTEAYA